MKSETFGKLIQADCTYVMIDNSWYLVKLITRSRKFIKVYGLQRIFHTGHITKFTNKAVA